MRSPLLLAACTAVPEAIPEPGAPFGPVIVAEGIQIGEEGDPPSCDEWESPVVDPSVPQGELPFSADAFLAALPVEGLSGTVELADGSSTPLDVGLTVEGEVRYVRRVPRFSGVLCDGPWYRVDVIVALVARPSLDERVWLWAEARRPEAPSWRGALLLDDVGGTLRPSAPFVAAWDELFLDLPAEGESAAWSGRATWYGRRDAEWGAEAAASWSSP